MASCQHVTLQSVVLLLLAPHAEASELKVAIIDTWWC